VNCRIYLECLNRMNSISWLFYLVVLLLVLNFAGNCCSWEIHCNSASFDLRASLKLLLVLWAIALSTPTLLAAILLLLSPARSVSDILPREWQEGKKLLWQFLQPAGQIAPSLFHSGHIDRAARDRHAFDSVLQLGFLDSDSSVSWLHGWPHFAREAKSEVHPFVVSNIDIIQCRLLEEVPSQERNKDRVSLWLLELWFHRAHISEVPNLHLEVFREESSASANIGR